MKTPRRTRIVVALLATLSATVVCASASAESPPSRTVLTIHSGAEAFPSNPILQAGIRESLIAPRDLTIDYFAEYLESDLFTDSEATLAFSDYLRRKYRGRRIDVVIGLTDTGLRFVLEHRQDLFPDASVVFAGVNGPDEATRSVVPVTGVTVGAAYAATARLALNMHPRTQRVFVIAKGEEAIVEPVRAALRELSSAATFTYLNEPTIPRLLEVVRAIPPESVILYIWHRQSGPGDPVYPDEVAKLVAAEASVPVYSTSDLYVGSGVVGGVMRSTRETGVRIGQMARQILMGRPAQDIPIEAARLATVLDWRQLRRWGISERRLPEGSIIQFRELSVWDRYRFYIFGAVGLMLAQMSLIAGLLVQRARRRQAENDARASQAELRTSYDRIRDLATRLLGAQETERARIARELHDDISQQMALLEIDLEMLSGTVNGEAEDLAGGVLHRAQSIAKSVHDLSHRLHPAKLRLLGLVAALRGFEREASRSDLAVSFTHRSVPPVLPEDLTLCLFRVAQEALQNAVKYARAKKVAVSLEGSPDGLALTVADDGVGFDVDAAWGKGLGLVSMRERLDAVGGTLDIRSTPGGGTRVQISVPLPVIEDAEAAAAV
jgi:signal transduction histidine kinase